MYWYAMKSHDIRHNLATEQYLMNNKKFDEPLVLFYYEGPCIIVGRNQNTLEEINQKYVEEHNITVTRRLSGGGAVYQDLGNLCFSFVVDSDSEEFGDFKSFVQPVVDALHAMGATTAEVSGRNDILVDGKKFSGNAMYSHSGKTFSHGTLMLDVDQDVIAHALNVPEDKMKSKGIKSVRSRVTNLKPYLAPEYQNLTVPEFRDTLLKELFQVKDLKAIADKEVTINDDEKVAIDEIYNDYYNNWDWVYGNSPEFTVKKRQHFTAGTIDARLLVEGGKIKNLKFYGDFFGPADATELADKLTGVRYDREHVGAILDSVDTQQYFNGIPTAEVLDLLVD
ncbi:lipoate--protein ligase [Levilactobacillus brevis]|uniref:lipoate--protein ligase n=1 Tax=Levilactobacillus brevis TaxID=1580 RepID=UPI001C1EA8C8|nr:lipoate--protein ligase [Levilactobacillus brevis]MBU7538545.1 lipoate--protein ligase [Levilactobacillus brevis]MBU7564680.1 lipoate--protein ligase [Levilactobacillus brevis]MCE6011903.1 lipoate--protein ligase [Levilactobacillus brevis]MCE6014322.1 lipoate--protein ligase [Levilactobacillus brevis]MCE6016672.1 lipoate--protein ligase [Levilactobacillus brevis]